MKKLSLSAGAVLLVVGLAGCAGAAPAPTNAPGESSSLEVTSLTVGVIPTSDTATVYVAQDLGYFADEGLTVTMEVMQNAAAIVPGVMNGQIQFGTAAIPPILSAISEGLPLRIVANGGNVPVDAAQDPSGVLVAADSGITSAADLDGKIVAVNALQAMGELVTRQAIDNAGGDATSVTFVAMPFPDMANAVQRGDVDAAFVVEPFLSFGLSAGLETVVQPYHAVLVPGKSNAVFFTSEQFTQQAPDTVAAFTRALDRAAEAATKEPQLIRDALMKYGKVDPDVAAAINLPEYSAGVSPEAIDRFLEIMVGQGFLTDSIPDTASVLYP